MKPADVKSSTYFDFNKENNKEDPEFRVGDHVGYQNMKMFLQNLSFAKSWTYVISDPNGE